MLYVPNVTDRAIIRSRRILSSCYKKHLYLDQKRTVSNSPTYIASMVLVSVLEMFYVRFKQVKSYLRQFLFYANIFNNFLNVV